MFERELLLLKSYMEELSDRPTFGKADEARSNDYSNFVANEVLNRLLTEEFELPLYVPDRLPYSAFEIVENYILELQAMLVNTTESDATDVIKTLIKKAELIQELLNTGETDDPVYTCQEVFTGRYFKSNVEKVKRAVDLTNQDLNQNGSVSLNTYFYHLGIPGIKIGYNFVWDISECSDIQVEFIPGESEDHRHKCLYVDLKTYPTLSINTDGSPWAI